jgi:hypothetical protein
MSVEGDLGLEPVTGYLPSILGEVINNKGELPHQAQARKWNHRGVAAERFNMIARTNMLPDHALMKSPGCRSSLSSKVRPKGVSYWADKNERYPATAEKLMTKTVNGG